jgi:hypothetical protein
VVVQGGKTPEESVRALAQNHDEALAEKSVVLLLINDEDRGNIGTGVFIGIDGSGQTGYILTAAHVLTIRGGRVDDGIPMRPSDIQITFGPSQSRAGGNRIAFMASRAVVHPDFGAYLDASMPGRHGKRLARWMVRNDLALLEFPLGSNGADHLERRGIRAARLYDGAGYEKPLREARIAGFGQSGTHQGVGYRNQPRIQAGMTLVSHGTWRGHTGFTHWSPVSSTLSRWLSGKDRSQSLDLSGFQFEMMEPATYVNSLDQSLIRVASHPKQALGAIGDSGGPLFLETRRGPEVAGIYSICGYEYLTSYFTGAKARWFHCHQWAPVKENLAWIRGVMTGAEGLAGYDRIVEFGHGPVDLDAWGLFGKQPGMLPPASAGPNPKAAEERKGESKVERKGECKVERKREKKRG